MAVKSTENRVGFICEKCGRFQRGVPSALTDHAYCDKCNPLKFRFPSIKVWAINAGPGIVAGVIHYMFYNPTKSADKSLAVTAVTTAILFSIEVLYELYLLFRYLKE